MLILRWKKIFGLLFCASMLYASSSYAMKGDFEISCTRNSPKEAKKVEKALTEDGYQDVGHYLYFINLVTPIKNAGLTFMLERPLLKDRGDNADQKMTVLSTDLEGLQMVTKNKYPHLLISSRGFFPGEEVEVYFYSGINVSNILKIKPYPVEASSYYDNATISAKLVSVSPTMYHIFFKDFRDNETIEIISESCGEKFVHKFKVNKNGSMTQMPAVVNRNGGMNNISFRRENGETMKISMPWGTDLYSYLYGEVTPDFE